MTLVLTDSLQCESCDATNFEILISLDKKELPGDGKFPLSTLRPTDITQVEIICAECGNYVDTDEDPQIIGAFFHDTLEVVRPPDGWLFIAACGSCQDTEPPFPCTCACPDCRSARMQRYGFEQWPS